MTPTLALHKAIYAALSGMTVNGVDVPVLDAVSQEQAFPYVTIDTHRSSQMDALVEKRDDRYVFLSVWSETRGQEEVIRIMAELASRLDRVRLSLDNGFVRHMSVYDVQTRRDADNVTFQGTVILRAMTEH